jgi:predicted kinase
MKEDLSVTILVGIPGSGKSTWRDVFLKKNPDFVLIHPDSIRKELTGNEEDQSKNDEVFKLAFKRMDEALKAGKSVVFDSCAQNKKRRKPIIEIAKTNGARVFAMTFRIPLELAKERNSKRERVVPEFVLERMFAQWQDPSKDEGFDLIGCN